MKAPTSVITPPAAPTTAPIAAGRDGGTAILGVPWMMQPEIVS